MRGAIACAASRAGYKSSRPARRPRLRRVHGQTAVERARTAPRRPPAAPYIAKPGPSPAAARARRRGPRARPLDHPRYHRIEGPRPASAARVGDGGERGGRRVGGEASGSEGPQGRARSGRARVSAATRKDTRMRSVSSAAGCRLTSDSHARRPEPVCRFAPARAVGRECAAAGPTSPPHPETSDQRDPCCTDDIRPVSPSPGIDRLFATRSARGRRPRLVPRWTCARASTIPSSSSSGVAPEQVG